MSRAFLSLVNLRALSAIGGGRPSGAFHSLTRLLLSSFASSNVAGDLIRSFEKNGRSLFLDLSST